MLMAVSRGDQPGRSPGGNVEDVLRQDQAIRGDHQDVRRGVAQPLLRRGGVVSLAQRSGRVDGNSVRLRQLLDRARGELHASAGRPVGLRQHERDRPAAARRGVDEGGQGRGGKRRRSREHDAHAAILGTPPPQPDRAALRAAPGTIRPSPDCSAGQGETQLEAAVGARRTVPAPGDARHAHARRRGAPAAASEGPSRRLRRRREAPRRAEAAAVAGVHAPARRDAAQLRQSRLGARRRGGPRSPHPPDPAAAARHAAATRSRRRPAARQVHAARPAAVGLSHHRGAAVGRPCALHQGPPRDARRRRRRGVRAGAARLHAEAAQGRPRARRAAANTPASPTSSARPCARPACRGSRSSSNCPSSRPPSPGW